MKFFIKINKQSLPRSGGDTAAAVAAVAEQGSAFHQDSDVGASFIASVVPVIEE